MTNPPRKEILITGPWKIAFDPENEGVRAAWYGQGWPDERALPARVAEIWNLEYPDAEGVAFYRAEFRVPADWQGAAILLRFQGVMYRCEAWVNETYAGSHEGGFTPFELDITGCARLGAENSLVVRVVALSKKRAVDGMQIQHAPLSKQTWYYVFGGIWGHVSLAARPRLSLESVHANPHLQRQSVQLEVKVRNRRQEFRLARLVMKIRDPRGETVREQETQLSCPPGDATFQFTFSIPRPMPWSCERPDLYELECALAEEGGPPDSQQVHFGMRDFTLRGGQFYLNNEPVYIRGILLQPNYPVKLVNHPDHEMMAREIRLAKEAGFNLLRCHLQPPAPEYLDLADRMGMLIYAETSLAWIRDNPRLHDHGQREVREMIELDRNHPSVVFWGVYNENPTASAINGRALAHYARSLDPTRVIVEDSGGSLAIDQDFGWIDRAVMTPAWEDQPEPLMDIHLYLGSPTPGPIYAWLAALGSGVSSRVLVDEQFGSLAVVGEFDRECRAYAGQFFVSELGCGGMANLDEQVAGFGGREDLLDARELKILRDSLNHGFQARGLERVFGSTRQLYREAQELQCIGNTQQIEALLTNPRVSGYMVTQLNDVAWEFHAGLLDLWRRPKLAYEAARRANRAQVVILRAASPCLAVGESLEASLTLVSHAPLSGDAWIEWEAQDSTSQEIARGRISEIPGQPGIYALEAIRLEGCAAGTCVIRARLLLDGVLLDETTETVWVAGPPAWPQPARKVRVLGRLPEGLPVESGPDGLVLAADPESCSWQDWETLCQAVEAGSVAVIGALRPDHRAALAGLARHGLDVKLQFGIGSWMGCYHWAPQSDLFAGMPAGGLAKQPYTGILPKYVFPELGGEVLAGSLRNTQSRLEAPAMLWYSDVEAVRLGKGTVIFCQYRIFDRIGEHPLAGRMAANLLGYAGGLL